MGNRMQIVLHLRWGGVIKPGKERVIVILYQFSFLGQEVRT